MSASKSTIFVYSFPHSIRANLFSETDRMMESLLKMNNDSKSQ